VVKKCFFTQWIVFLTECIVVQEQLLAGILDNATEGKGKAVKIINIELQL